MGFFPTNFPHTFILFIYSRSSKLHPTHSQLFFQSHSSLTLHLPQEHHFHSSGHSMSRGSCTPNLQLNVIGKWYGYTWSHGFLASKHVALHHVHYEELPSLFNIHLSNATSSQSLALSKCRKYLMIYSSQVIFLVHTHISHK